jgi:DNA polymerase I-like protein with 3'-5' exonuclease and polymerase domains
MKHDRFEKPITDIQKGIDLLRYDQIISFDIETTGLSPWRDNIALMQFWGDKTQTPVVIRISDGVVPEDIKALFTEGGRTYVGHNVAGFDVLFLDTHGVEWKKNRWYDTLIGEGIISTTGRRDVSKNLKNSIRRRLGFKIDKDIEHGNWTAAELSDKQIEYAVNDVIYLQDLMDEQVKKAESQGQLEALQMEMNLAPMVAQMTINGLPLVRSKLNEWLDEQRVASKENEAWLKENLGDINYNSPKQILEAFAAKGFELPNTRKSTLAEIANFGEGLGSELCAHLLEYRAPAQRLKMYQKSWQDRYIINDWVHARFWQVGTATLRFSSSDPNLQQVPKDGRKIIGNVPGLTIVSADYSQIEVRIAAEIANDETLKEILESGDVHRGVAAQVYGKPPEEITDEERRNAKAATFTLLFGGGPGVLYQYSRNTGSMITEDDAREIFARFFAAFKGLKQVRNKAYNMAKYRKVVPVKLPNGAKRLLAGYNASGPKILNTVVQGSAAIGIKYALMEADKMGLTKYIGATVHDEFVAAVPDDEAREYGEALKEAMIRGMQRAFPNMTVYVEVKYGRYWQS